MKYTFNTILEKLRAIKEEYGINAAYLWVEGMFEGFVQGIEEINEKKEETKKTEKKEKPLEKNVTIMRVKGLLQNHDCLSQVDIQDLLVIDKRHYRTLYGYLSELVKKGDILSEKNPNDKRLVNYRRVKPVKHELGH